MEGLDEERRLFYVAITRAEQFLTLTYANSRYRYGKMQYNEASRFLEEIAMDHLETTFPIRRKVEAVATGAKVMGNFKPVRKSCQHSLHADPATFKPDASDAIQVGMKILHLKFGEGKVLSIDGSPGKSCGHNLFSKELIILNERLCSNMQNCRFWINFNCGFFKKA